jgi:hypothetical protein
MVNKITEPGPAAICAGPGVIIRNFNFSTNDTSCFSLFINNLNFKTRRARYVKKWLIISKTVDLILIKEISDLNNSRVIYY